jgi:hypothetical protein
MDLVFSAGWLYLFIFLMLLCVWRIVVKAQAINREARMDTRVIHIEPFTPERKEPAAGAHGLDMEALLKAEEALQGRLVRQAGESGPAGRAGLLLNLGRLYRDMAGISEKRENLIKAARAYYEGTQLTLPAEDDQKVSLLAGLGDTYLELSPVYETQECLARAMQAYATALKGEREGDPVRFAAICESFSEAALLLSGHADGEVNRERAAKALKAGLAALDEQEHGEQHRRMREKLVEVELG